MELQRFDRNAGRDEIVAALRDVGAVILTERVDAGIADAVARELRPSFDTAGRATESDFNGYSTLRLSAILALSRSSAELIGHQRVLDIIEAGSLGVLAHIRAEFGDSLGHGASA